MSSRRTRALCSWVLLPSALSLFSSSTARAQGNDRSAPTGGRSVLMGNTGVALGHDGSAPFLNPATIVGIGDQSLAFSVNFFTLQHQTFSNWHQPGAVDASRFGDLSLSGTSETSQTFKALPSTLCLFFTVVGIGGDNDDKQKGWRRGKRKLAICLGSVEADEVGLSALGFHAVTPVGTTAQVQSFNRSWNRLLVGPTYSFALSDSVALGASLHGVLTGASYSINGSAVSSAAGGGVLQSTLTSAQSAHAFDMVAILGGIWRTGPLTIGASAQIPAFHVYGQYHGTYANNFTASNATAVTDNAATVISANGSFHAPPPIRVSLGAGIEAKRLTIELDASYDFARAEALAASATLDTSTLTPVGVAPTTTNASYTVGSHGALNVGAGAEYFMSPSFSLVGGVSTNLSALDPLSPTSSLGILAPARTSAVNLAIGIGSYGAAGELMIGTQFSLGWGEMIAANPYVLPNDWAVIDTHNYSALIVLAGKTNLRTLGRALDSVEQVVTDGKPRDAPTTTAPLIPSLSTPATPNPGAPTAPEVTQSAPNTPGKPKDESPKETSPTDPPQNAPNNATPVKPSVLPPHTFE